MPLQDLINSYQYHLSLLSQYTQNINAIQTSLTTLNALYNYFQRRRQQQPGRSGTHRGTRSDEYALAYDYRQASRAVQRVSDVPQHVSNRSVRVQPHPRAHDAPTAYGSGDHAPPPKLVVPAELYQDYLNGIV
jgi:hypothetical protein